jgi:hypothetical protein
VPNCTSEAGRIAVRIDRCSPKRCMIVGLKSGSWSFPDNQSGKHISYRSEVVQDFPSLSLCQPLKASNWYGVGAL